MNQLRTAIELAEEVYNTERTHWSMGLRTSRKCTPWLLHQLTVGQERRQVIDMSISPALPFY